MSVIQVTDLSFSYEDSGEPVFDHVSFHIDTDWRLGFIGRNGRGKTTFLKLLMGEYEYSGSIQLQVPVDYFPFQVSQPQLDTIDCLYCLEPEMELWRIKKEMASLQLKEEILYQPFETLSRGEQTKILLALLFSRENHFLLIDEPTNHLDGPSRKLVGEYLREKKGFILVSHDRAFLDSCVDHILSFNRSDIQVQKGNYSSWDENRKRRDAFETAENDRLKKDIRRLKESSRQAGKWADEVESVKIGRKGAAGQKDRPNRDYIGEKSRRMQQRRKNLEQRQKKNLEEKEKLLKNVEQAEELKLMPLAYHQERLVSARDLTIAYDGKRIGEPVSFEVQRGDRLALNGRNGCGKSSLIRLIMGEEIEHSGEILIASGLIISYVSQDTSFLKGNLSDFIRSQDLEESLVKTLLRKLDFSREQFEKNMEVYSEGQKKKVLLAASLCRPAHLYIWDEPLNYIDLYSRVQLEKLILRWRPTMIFVEHDRMFMEKTATKQLPMY
ncbi:MAG: ribosomal protection-like ABC-F family protein [Ruminococcus sp.]|jgi:lincosamide and streptogramin A transport system ATP-binding/permease protein